jgi:hypothetical protein
MDVPPGFFLAGRKKTAAHDTYEKKECSIHTASPGNLIIRVQGNKKNK